MEVHATIKLQNTAVITARRIAAVPRGISHATTIFADRAENAEVWDVDGRRFVDFAGGIAVLNTGHRHPKVMRAVQEQMGRFTHTAFQVAPYESYVALAERLNGIAPISSVCKTALFTTGAEAVENAVKVARAATSRSAVVAFAGGFHGRTLFASALTGKVAPYKEAFGPGAPEVYHLPFPVSGSEVAVAQSMAALDLLFQASVAPQAVAAIILEPVQGEGGFHVAPKQLLAHLRGVCDRHGIVLIADEIQTGFARTGAMFAIEHSGVEPDLITIAKSLAGGFPLSGLIGRAELMDAPVPGGLGGTYAGSPIGCAAALAVLDVIEEDKLVERARVLGERIRSRLTSWRGRSDMTPISQARGLGAMVAFDVETDAGGPDSVRAKKVCAAAQELGLILLSCGVHGNVIRILVPLTADDQVVDLGLDRLEAALVAAMSESARP